MKHIVFNAKNFAFDLKHKRVLVLDWSMQQVSDHVGVSKATYSRAEKGKIVDLMTFVRLTDWLEQPAYRYFDKHDYSPIECPKND